MSSLHDSSAPAVTGHVLIRNRDDGTVLVSKYNAINTSVMAYALALGLADRPTGHIQSMVFGNGGSVVTGTGDISYYPPNTTGIDGQLYNQTYAKVVDDQSPLDVNTTENFIAVNYTTNVPYADVVVTCTLDFGEPNSTSLPAQDAFDNATTQSAYVFDELGLMTYDPTSGSGMLLSHVIFNPVQKSLNRSIEIIYTIRILMQ